MGGRTNVGSLLSPFRTWPMIFFPGGVFVSYLLYFTPPISPSNPLTVIQLVEGRGRKAKALILSIKSILPDHSIPDSRPTNNSQANSEGEPVMDFGHIYQTLARLDAGGDDEKILLTSRDKRSLLVASFADIKRCLDEAFAEVSGHAGPLPASAMASAPGRGVGDGGRGGGGVGGRAGIGGGGNLGGGVHRGAMMPGGRGGGMGMHRAAGGAGGGGVVVPGPGGMRVDGSGGGAGAGGGGGGGSGGGGGVGLMHGGHRGHGHVHPGVIPMGVGVHPHHAHHAQPQHRPHHPHHQQSPHPHVAMAMGFVGHHPGAPPGPPPPPPPPGHGRPLPF